METEKNITFQPLKQEVKENGIIFVVDDELTILKSLSDMLSSSGYSVETSHNGTAALKKAKAIKPNIILLDVKLPDSNGVEICKELKTDPETMHIPVIVFTSLNDKETRIAALAAGANDFLAKPLDNMELLIKIGNHIQLQKIEEIKRKTKILEATFKAVETARKEWEQILDCIDDMIVLMDIDGSIVRCNKVFREFTGKSYEEIAGRNWKDLLLENNIDAEAVYGQSIEFFHKLSEKWFTISFYPVSSPSSREIFGTVISIRDFTALKMVTEALEITNISIDNDRRDLKFALDEISFLLQEVERNKDLRIRFNIPDSSQSDFIYQIGSHFNNMMSMLEQKHKELQAAQSHLLQQEKMASIGQLAAGVAHEINNPTGFIMSNLGSLQKYANRMSEFIKKQSEAIEELSGYAKENADAVLDRIKEHHRSLKIDYITDDSGSLIKESLDGAERIKRIVQDLKSFSHVDEAEWKIADINAGIESAINMVWNELKYKVELKKDFGSIPLTMCNPGQLNQVVMNMLINAAQAIEKQGEITVRTWHENNHVCVSISDTGCGMPEDKLNRIFEPFYTTKEVGKGTGLGLSIAYDIVKKHNGEITVKSETGKGTTFTVKIPVA